RADLLELLGGLILDLWPVVIGARDVARNILAPALADVRVVIQVKLLVNDAPDIRVALELVAIGGTHRAEAAELRKIGIGVGLELPQVLGACEVIRYTIMFDLELGTSFLGLAAGEISNSVVALQPKAFVVSIDGGRGTGNDCQSRRKHEAAGNECNGCKRH